jgi:hypothetical protein
MTATKPFRAFDESDANLLRNAGFCVELMNGEYAIDAGKTNIYEIILNAVAGSTTQQVALHLCKRFFIAYHNSAVQDVDVVETAGLDEGEGNFTHPWLLVFPNAEVLGFGTEEEACKRQRVYRIAVGLDPVTGE